MDDFLAMLLRQLCVAGCVSWDKWQHFRSFHKQTFVYSRAQLSLPARKILQISRGTQKYRIVSIKKAFCIRFCIFIPLKHYLQQLCLDIHAWLPIANQTKCFNFYSMSIYVQYIWVNIRQLHVLCQIKYVHSRDRVIMFPSRWSKIIPEDHFSWCHFTGL